MLHDVSYSIQTPLVLKSELNSLDRKRQIQGVSRRMLREKDVDDDRKWRSSHSHSVSKHVFADPPFLVILALGSPKVVI